MANMLMNVRARFEASPLARRFLGGAAWSVLGAVVSNGVTLVMLMFVARFLGKEIYGQFVVIQSTLGMVGVFAGFGIGAAATRYVAELRRINPARLGHILALAERSALGFGLIASLGLVILAEWMASHLLNEPGVGTPLAIASIAVFFTALDAYQKSVLIGFESMRAFAIGNIAGVIAGFPIMLLSVSCYGLQGAAIAMVAIAFIQAAISRYQVARELNKSSVERYAAGCLREWPVLWHFALPALISGALVSPAHWAAQAFLANTQGGYAELAVLGIAMQWFNVILFVPSTAGRVVGPILTEYATRNDHGNSRKILMYSMGANALVAIPIGIFIAVLSPYIMSLYGKDFESAYLPMLVAIATAALLAVLSPVGNLIVALSRMWLGALMNAGWAAVYISLAYLLVGYGAIGVMLALGAGYAAHASWTLWFAYHQIGFRVRTHEQ